MSCPALSPAFLKEALSKHSAVIVKELQMTLFIYLDRKLKENPKTCCARGVIHQTLL